MNAPAPLITFFRKSYYFFKRVVLSFKASTLTISKYGIKHTIAQRYRMGHHAKLHDKKIQEVTACRRSCFKF